MASVYGVRIYQVLHVSNYTYPKQAGKKSYRIQQTIKEHPQCQLDHPLATFTRVLQGRQLLQEH